VFSERTSVGLDVHARSIVGCGLGHGQRRSGPAPVEPTAEGVSAWLAELPAPVAVAYEVGPTGFGLARQLTAAGIRCVVAAPSKLQRPPGDRVKNDLSTELPDRIPPASPKLLSGVARLRGHGQRRGCAAGIVAIGGAAVRVA
jgi:hypothetical protein